MEKIERTEVKKKRLKGSAIFAYYDNYACYNAVFLHIYLNECDNEANKEDNLRESYLLIGSIFFDKFLSMSACKLVQMVQQVDIR